MLNRHESEELESKLLRGRSVACFPCIRPSDIFGGATGSPKSIPVLSWPKVQHHALLPHLQQSSPMILLPSLLVGTRPPKTNASLALHFSSSHKLTESMHSRAANHQQASLALRFSSSHMLTESMHSRAANHQQHHLQALLWLAHRRQVQVGLATRTPWALLWLPALGESSLQATSSQSLIAVCLGNHPAHPSRR